MIVEEKDGLTVYRFENLSRFPEIRHGIFSRKGGFSSPPFDSLNVSHGVGDKPENVERNRSLLAKALGGKTLAYLRQVHSDMVMVWGDDADSRALFEQDTAPEGDAMVTDSEGVHLVIQTADCQAVLLYDPVLRVVANVHSGWRGSVANIAGKTVAEMKRAFGCNPAHIRAGVGPSLGPCCSEFVNYENEIPEHLWKYQAKEFFFDFWAITRDQLTEQGVLPENVETGGVCTRCSTDLFFSYRKEKVTGRFAGIIGIERTRKL